MADSKDDPIHASFNIKDLLTPARDRGGKDQHLSTPFASDHDHVQDTTFGNGDLVRLKVVDVPSDAKESVAANTSKMKQATETIRLLMREKQESMTKMGDLRSELSQVEHRYRQEQENTQTVLSDLEMEKTKTDRLKQELMQWQRKYEHESNQWERKIEMQTNNYQRELEKRERELDRQRKTKAESEKAYTEELRLKSALLEEKNQELIKLVQLEGSEQNQIKLLQHDKEVLMEKLHASDIELKEATVTLENTTKQLSQKREELMAAQEHITRINTENLKTESSDIMLLKEQLIITQKEGERFQGQIEACQQVIDEGRRENQSLVTAISTSSQIIHAQFNDSLEKWNAEVNGRLLHLEGRFSTLHEQERRLATLLQTSSTQSSENTSTTKQNLLHLEQKKAIMEQRVYMVKNELAIKEKEMAQLRLQHTEQLKKLEDQLTVSADTSAKLTNKLRTANDEVAKVRQMFQFEKTCSLQAQRVVENERLKEQEVASSTIHSLKESNTKLATQLEDTREMMLTELRAIQNKHNEHISTLVQSHNDLLREERKQGRNEAASYEDANSRAMKKQTSAHNLEMEKMRAHMENMHQELKATAQELAATKTGLETASNQLVQYAEQLKDYDMMKQNVMDFKEQMLVSQTQSEAASKHVQGAHRMAAAAKEDALKIQQECQRLRKSLDEREGQYQELSAALEKLKHMCATAESTIQNLKEQNAIKHQQWIEEKEAIDRRWAEKVEGMRKANEKENQHREKELGHEFDNLLREARSEWERKQEGLRQTAEADRLQKQNLSDEAVAEMERELRILKEEAKQHHIRWESKIAQEEKEEKQRAMEKLRITKEKEENFQRMDESEKERQDQIERELHVLERLRSIAESGGGGGGEGLLSGLALEDIESDLVDLSDLGDDGVSDENGRGRDTTATKSARKKSKKSKLLRKTRGGVGSSSSFASMSLIGQALERQLKLTQQRVESLLRVNVQLRVKIDGQQKAHAKELNDLRIVYDSKMKKRKAMDKKRLSTRRVEYDQAVDIIKAKYVTEITHYQDEVKHLRVRHKQHVKLIRELQDALSKLRDRLTSEKDKSKSARKEHQEKIKRLKKIAENEILNLTNNTVKALEKRVEAEIELRRAAEKESNSYLERLKRAEKNERRMMRQLDQASSSSSSSSSLLGGANQAELVNYLKAMVKESKENKTASNDKSSSQKADKLMRQVDDLVNRNVSSKNDGLVNLSSASNLLDMDKFAISSPSFSDRRSPEMKITSTVGAAGANATHASTHSRTTDEYFESLASL